MTPLDRDSLGTRLLEFIQSQYPGKTVATDTVLPQNVLDSLGIFAVVSFIENSFGVALDDSELTVENFNSVNTLVDLIGRRSQPK